ncbi:unnamed protein product [Lactuca saligna]|uniref:Uncharacterized protein n=1 Tax=Lactuca saligna TaxID=75948 RepID=A0AA35VTQ7_LACSI|nr:unnamed protein product [Lactuca saligna]
MCRRHDFQNTAKNLVIPARPLATACCRHNISWSNEFGQNWQKLWRQLVVRIGGLVATTCIVRIGVVAIVSYSCSESGEIVDYSLKKSIPSSPVMASSLLIHPLSSLLQIALSSCRRVIMIKAHSNKHYVLDLDIEPMKSFRAY